jgi:tRNA A-37 threonylcarbamoyl transferase component Bud32
MTSPTVPEFHGARWHLPADLRPLLLGPGGLRLTEWLESGQAQPVKHGPLRTIYRVTLPGLAFHLKHYRPVGLRSRLRESLRPVKARAEHDQAVRLLALGVPTPEPIGWGRLGPAWSPTASLLLTRTLDARPLLDFLEHELPALPALRQARIRQRLACALGRFLARMHTAGVIHDDLHPGNLLFRTGADGRIALHLIDLHAVRFVRPCPWPACRDNLVIFNRFFILRADRSDRLRFWTAYHAARCGTVLAPSAPTARDLERRTVESNCRFWVARDRRCREANRYYRMVRQGPSRGYAVRDLDPAMLTPLLADPAETFRRPDVRLLKDSRSSTVAEFDLAVDGVVSQRVIFKRFRVTDRREPWVALVRRSAALRSWVYGHGLRERLLPTPRPLAVWHEYRGGLPRDGFLLTLKVPDAVDLHAFVRDRTGLPPVARRAILRPCLERLARLIGEFHRRRLVQRDLKASNLLVSGDERDPRLVLIDLVGVHCPRRLPRRLRVRDLARLHASFHTHPAVSRTDKLRFLKLYLQTNLRGPGNWKRWWREIAAATEVKVRRNRRRGRPLA